MFSIVMLVPHTNLQGLKLVLCVNRRHISLMSRNEVPASVPTAPYMATLYISGYYKPTPPYGVPTQYVECHIVYKVSLLFTIKNCKFEVT